MSNQFRKNNYTYTRRSLCCRLEEESVVETKNEDVEPTREELQSRENVGINKKNFCCETQLENDAQIVQALVIHFECLQNGNWLIAGGHQKKCCESGNTRGWFSRQYGPVHTRRGSHTTRFCGGYSGFGVFSPEHFVFRSCLIFSLL